MSGFWVTRSKRLRLICKSLTLLLESYLGASVTWVRVDLKSVVSERRDRKTCRDEILYPILLRSLETYSYS